MKSFDKKDVIYKFEHGMRPIATLKDGESFTVETNDCFLQQVKSDDDLIEEIDMNKVNPATGPFYVENAQVGDLLKVEILDIRINDQGTVVVLPGGGGLADQATKPLTRIVPVENGKVNFLGIKSPIDPMIGVIGVSPGKEQESVLTGVPYNHGGNMDTTDVRKGATLYFPVREEGALLALGDFHAIMGDGELCISGLEVEAEADLKVSVVKDVKTTWPILENDEEIMVIASGESLEIAVQNAATELTEFVQKSFDIMWEEAYMFSSLFVDYKISQVVNEMRTVRAVVKKDILDIDTLFKAIK